MAGTAPSAVAAIEPAIEHTKRLLFRPFDLSRWIMLGFLSFLEALGGGCNGNVNLPGGGGRSQSGGDAGAGAEQAVQWIMAHLPLVIGLTAAVFLFFLVLLVVFQWLSARGTFCYIDCVATNRAEVKRPWAEHQEIANSFFRFRLFFFLSVFLAILVWIAAGAAAAWAVLPHSGGGIPDEVKVPFFGGLLVWGIGFLILLLAMGIVATLLADFVAPVQFHRRVSCLEAWKIVWGLVGANLGAFGVYLLLRFAIGMGIATAVVFLGCATCCIFFCVAAIPVIGQTVLQPVLVFQRAFPLYFLRQFGTEFDCLPPV